MNGVAHLFSFPFWLYVDSSAPLATGMATVGATSFRFYPPFRSGATNFSPMPNISFANVPFEPGARPQRPLPLLSVAVLPLLRADGGPGIVSAWSTNSASTEVMQPMDSLRIDVYGSQSAGELEIDAVLRRLLERIRVTTRQWWVLRSSDALLRYGRHGFKIDARGAPTGETPVNLSYARIPFGFETGINNCVWTGCVEAAVRGTATSMYELTLLDAYYYVAADDFRNAVVQATSALEQAIENCCTSLWKARGMRKFRRGYLTGDNATVHVSRDMDRFFKRSFSREFPKAFAQLRKLWDARGRVAHGGAAEFREHGQWVRVNDVAAEKMVRAVQTCIKWLSSIR